MDWKEDLVNFLGLVVVLVLVTASLPATLHYGWVGVIAAGAVVVWEMDVRFAFRVVRRRGKRANAPAFRS